jgi:malonyl CoA-acyl carrier protein transacylase
MQAFLFPGQGSQSSGMGRTLFDSVREYALIEREVDGLLGYSVREQCLKGPEARLRETRYTQPCLFVVNALYYYDAVSKHGTPDAVAGHSLGEYNALMAAGVFDLLTGVRLVAERGALMASAGGGMLAVLNLASDRVSSALQGEGLTALDVANYNTPKQTVIAGPPDVLATAKTVLERQGATCVPLPVSGAFHSRYMSDAADRFARFLDSFSFRAPTLPVIANVTGLFYPQGADTATIRSFLVRQMTSPVRWLQGIRQLRERGITTLRETGPGGVLTRLCQQIPEREQLSV